MFNHDSVDFQNWSYSDLKTRSGKQGGQVFVNVNESTRDSPRFQLPQGRVPFGARVPQQDGGSTNAYPSHNMEFSVVRTGALAEWCKAVDESNLKFVVDQQRTLFPKAKNLTEDAIKAFYRTMLQQSSNEEYDPLMRIKIKGETNVYIARGDDMVEGTVDDIKPGCEVVPIVRVSGLWFVSKNFGMTLSATDVLVYPKRAKRKADFNRSGFKQGKVPKLCYDQTIPEVVDVAEEPEETEDSNNV